MLLGHIARKSSYTTRLVVLGATISVGFFAILAFVLWESRNQIEAQAKQAAANVISTLASEINRSLELYNLSLQAALDGIGLPELKQLSPEIRHRVLFDRAATAKDLGSIAILDAKGNVIVDSASRLIPDTTAHAQKDYFTVHAKGSIVGPYVSRPWEGRNGEFLIAISRRISNEDDSFAGAVVGTLRLNYFRDLFSNVRLSPDDSLTLVRSDGSLIMRTPYPANLIGSGSLPLPMFKTVGTSRTGSIEANSTIDGIERLFVFQRIGDYPLILAYGVALDNIYTGWWHRALVIGALMLAMGSINIALIVFLARTLKERTEAENQLALLAGSDSLTGLCNRRHFDEVYAVEWRSALCTQRPLALLIVDADHFKSFNDRFGHLAGDNALIEIANCLKSARRPKDVCARYGGEEFAVLLPGASTEEAIAVAQRIHANLAKRRTSHEASQQGVTTVSIGAASIVPQLGVPVRELFNLADAALYKAKHKGRNRTEPELAAYQTEAA